MLAQLTGALAVVLIGASVARSHQELQVSTSPLGVGSRDRLAICSQPAEGLTLDRDEAVAAGRAAFAELEKNPSWTAYAPYTVGGPVIDIGCPTVPAMFRPILGQYPSSRPISPREIVAAAVLLSVDADASPSALLTPAPLLCYRRESAGGSSLRQPAVDRIGDHAARTFWRIRQQYPK
jgi:hypothetical protein